MKPAPYNVVLEDGRYKGELKLGLKFLPNVSTHRGRSHRINDNASEALDRASIRSIFVGICLDLDANRNCVCR